MLADGNIYGFDAYCTEPDFLQRRAHLYRVPESDLHFIYSQMEVHRHLPEQVAVDSVHVKVRDRWQRMPDVIGAT